MSKVRSNTNLGNVTEVTQLAKFTTIALEDMVGIINGQIEFESNIRSNIVTATFTTSASDVRIPHALEKVPSGYIIVGTTDPASFYNGSGQWTSSEIYLRSSAVVSQARIMVF